MPLLRHLRRPRVRTRHVLQRPARARRNLERVGQSEREPLGAGPGDHGAVVGAQRRRWHHELDAGLERDAVEDFADRLVGGDAAGGDQRRRRPEAAAKDLHAGTQPVVDDLHHRLLERGAEIGHILVAERRNPLGFEPQRGLQSRQRKIRLRAAVHRPRQREARGLAALGLLLDLRPARIAEAEQLGGLVEGLADGVVDGGAEQRVFADAAHRHDLGVAAGGEEQAIGKRRAFDQPRGERMRFEVIDRHQRLAVDERDRLGGGQPDNDAADQAGTGRGRHAVDPVERGAGVGHGLADDAVERFHVGTRRDFGNHAAKDGMVAVLRQHHVGQDLARPLAAALHHRGRGLVASGFDSEYKHGGPWLNR
jgi:hypothetical protein